LKKDGYILKLAESRHIGSLSAIECQAARLFPANYLPASLLDETVPQEDLDYAQKNGLLWVALKNDDPVGYAFIQIRGVLPLLAQIDVHPDHGRQGLGRALIEKASSALRKKNFSELYLTTFASIPWNAPFYEKLGFQYLEQGSQPEFIKNILRSEARLGLKERVAMCLYL